jgi:hypothetical protein
LTVSSTPNSLILLVAHAGGMTPTPIITADAATAPASLLILISIRPFAVVLLGPSIPRHWGTKTRGHKRNV